MPTDDAPRPAGTGCLLVLGMHRSGTSAVTSSLARLGLDVGEPSELFPANDGNPHGYWEPAELIEINDALLASWGGTQRDPQLARRPASTHELPTALVDRMNAYAKRWDARAPFVWKDPRLCVTLPLWRPLLPIRGLVLAVRDPIAVAASLTARDMMSRQAGLVLWESYVRSLLAALEHTPRLVVHYEDLVQDAETVVAQLAEFTQRTVGGPPGDHAAALREIERRAVPRTDERPLTAIQRHLYRRLSEGAFVPDTLADPEVVALLDAGTRLGWELTRQTFIQKATEEKLERTRANAARTPRKRAKDGFWKRWRKRVWRLRARR